jgi:hypothetical protein
MRDTRVLAPLFSLADSERAHDEWGANCGPGALAAIVRCTLDEVRPYLGDFESKGYTNPTLMFDALRAIGAHFEYTMLGKRCTMVEWPTYGLARVQWEGPWTEPGVPMAARYRHTHWVGAARRDDRIGIFDINCMNNGQGWVSLDDWRTKIAPWIIRLCVPRGYGTWHLTHAIEVFK